MAKILGKTKKRTRPGSAKNPHRLDITVPKQLTFDGQAVTRYLYNVFTGKTFAGKFDLKKVKAGDIVNVNLSTTYLKRIGDTERWRSMKKTKSITWKRGKKKLTKNLATHLARQQSHDLVNPRYPFDEEEFKKNIHQFKRIDAPVDIEPTVEKRRKIVKPPPYKGDRRFKVTYDYSVRRFRDSKGRFR